MVLLCLLTLSLLVQSAIQDSQKWKGERNTFKDTMTDLFAKRLTPIQILDSHFTEFVLCRRNDSNPYGLSNLRLKVSCPAGQLHNCSLYGTRNDGMEIMIVDCRFAVEIIQYGPGKLLAALCYQNTITGSRSTKGEIPPSVLCRRWRYPGTKLPQLQLPGYLKSPQSSVLLYTTASLELSGNNSTSQNTTQWPVNNYERTGFGGKGTLPQFGPNPALYLLVTRRSNGTTEVFIEETDDYTALPQLWVNTSTTVEGPTEPKESKLTTYCNMSEIYTMLQNRTQYHNGYLKNRYNTDNAWLEGTIIHPHDDTGGCFSRFPVNTEVQSRRYRWLVLPNSTTPRNFALSFGISSGVHLGNGTHAYS